MTWSRKRETVRQVLHEGVGGLVRLVMRNVPAVVPTIERLFPRAWKEWNELGFWRSRKRRGTFSNAHYEAFFTRHFGLGRDFYVDKRVLDVGCGPMGSLEWADMTAERVGLDPLARGYRKLGADRHKMTYVAAPSECIPIPDAHFDVVSMFNALDHVEDIVATAAEVARVLKPGGLFLLMTDVGHEPTACEPQAISWDVLRVFEPFLEVIEESHYEKCGERFADTVERAVPFDHGNPAKRPGTLVAKLRKRTPIEEETCPTPRSS